MRPCIPLAALALLLPIAARAEHPTAPLAFVGDTWTEKGWTYGKSANGFTCAIKADGFMDEVGWHCTRVGGEAPPVLPAPPTGITSDWLKGKMNSATVPANPLIATLPQTDMPLADVIKAAKDGRVVVMQDGLKIRPRVVDGVPEACAVSEDASQMVLRVLKQTTSEIGDASVGTLLAILRIQRSLLPPGCPLP